MTTRPHDALFKAAFEHPTHAAALFRERLPPSLANQIDWDTLTLEPSSFIDPTLGSRHGDLLFSTRIGDQQVFLHLLLEHQSSNDGMLTFRVLTYIVRKWERHQRDHRSIGGKLPLVITLVVSHAPEGWTSPVHLHEVITPPPASLDGVAEFVPGFRLLVEDLAHLTNEQLKAGALAVFPKLVLWALRDARDADRLLHNLTHWVREFAEALKTPSGIEAVSRILRYIALVCEDLHYEQFRVKIREQLPEAEKPAMTMAEELIQKGRAEGRAEGREEGRAALRNLLLKLLARRFGDIPLEYRAAIEAATVEQLERYAERLVVVDTLATVFVDD